jgi:hypothetical protein
VGLVELLIALSISAAVLTAVGVATDASFKAYAVNQETASLAQRGRITLHRMLTYTRTCKEHQPIGATQITQFEAGTVVTDTGVSMFTDSDVQLDFTYDAPNRRILVIENGTTRELLRGVEAFSVKMEPMQSPAAIRAGSGYDLLRRATFTITVRTNGQSADVDETQDSQLVTVSSSVMPRRNSW